jgi:hypothetical protein
MRRDAAGARRLARVLMSDLAAYAGEELRIGLEKDDLFERLAPQLQQAWVFYSHRVDPGLAERERIFNHAVVDGLVYANRRVATHIF